jgi:AraC-like DNA-binding protein
MKVSSPDALPGIFFGSVNFRRRGVHFFSHVGLAPQSSLVAILRTGLRYDTRLTPAARSPGRGRIVLYVVMDGSLHPSDQAAPAVGASCWLMAEDDLEGAHGTRARSLRTSGDPFSSVTLHAPPSWFATPLRADGGPVRLTTSPEVIAAARAYLTCVRTTTDRAGWQQQTFQYIHALFDQGWLTPEVALTAMQKPTLGGRVWNALSTFYGRLELNPSLVQLADLAELSTRHVDRALKLWASDYGLPGEGWRDMTRRWRLKFAILLLSNPSLTVAEVAKVVGYSNAQALTNALAAESLPSPSAFRAPFHAT